MNNPKNQLKAASDTEGSEPVAQNERIVLILCGLVASGKSTFAKALEIYFPQFRRCCQDDLGSRQNVEEATREHLRLGYSVCVDRTNVDAKQRSHWTKIAHEFPGTSVWVIVFNTPYEICVERLRKRVSHPTIKSAEQGLPILARFANTFHHPVPREGYDCLLYLQPSSLPQDSQETSLRGLGSLNSNLEDLAYYTKAEVSSILRRVRGSTEALPPPNLSFPPDYTTPLGTPSIGPRRRRHNPSQGYHGNLSYPPPASQISSSTPVHRSGFRKDQGSSHNANDGSDPFPRRPLRYRTDSSPRHSQLGGEAAAQALPQGVGAAPNNSMSRSKYNGRALGKGSS